MLFCFTLVGLVLFGSVTLTLLLNPVNQVIINDIPIVDLTSPIIILSAEVDAWFQTEKLLTYYWVFPDGSISSEVSPSWNASSILAKNTAFTSFNLIVTGTMTIFGATAEPLPFYYYSARPILNATLIANCAGMTEGTLQLPASSNYSVSSILSVSQDCGLIRKITAVLEETETTTLVNTTGVTLSDVFEELSVSGIMPAGSKGNSAMKASATSSFIEWLLEPGSISISGSSEAQVSITSTLEFYPQLNFQFIVSGWRVELISLELGTWHLG